MRWLVACLLLGMPAGAETIIVEVKCGTYGQMTGDLEAGWGEDLLFQGPTNDPSYAVETHARPDGTWSFLLIRADGKTCLMFAGPTWIGFGIPQGEPG